MKTKLFYDLRRFRKGTVVWIMLGMVAVSFAQCLLGCDVPVFEYAIKLWPADAYEAVFIHRGEPQALQVMEDMRVQAAGRANLVVRDSAPDDEEGPLGAWLTEQDITALPWLVMRYPVRVESRRVVWSGPLESDCVEGWLDSPVRRQIAEYLKDGFSGVWLFVDSGNRTRDDEAYKVLVAELERLERVLVLQGGDLENQHPRFVNIRLQRDMAEEARLLTMLLESEPDLEGRSDDPMVFPIFGRGLILYALVGGGINPGMILEAAEYLTGDCSCEVKSENPGLEILLSTKWDEALTGSFADFESRAEKAEVMLEDMRGVPPATVWTSSMEDSDTSGDSGGGRALYAIIIAVVIVVPIILLSRKGGPGKGDK